MENAVLTGIHRQWFHLKENKRLCAMGAIEGAFDILKTQRSRQKYWRASTSFRREWTKGRES